MKVRTLCFDSWKNVGEMRHRSARASVTLGICIALTFISTATSANPSSDETVYDIAIPSLDVAQALNRLAEQTGAIMLFPYDLAKTRRAKAVFGRHTLTEALELLLEGSGLSGGLSDKRVVQISLDEVVAHSDEEGQMARTEVSFGKKVGAFFTGVFVAFNAAAQDGESGISAQSNELDEIVVTAQKREQNLQDVAFSLSAMSGDQLAELGLTGEEDYLAQMPGVHYNSLGPGRSNVTVRGIATSTGRDNLQPTTDIYVDDMPTLNRWSAWNNTDLNTFDLERVEVLRGPQGTLFGAGALGGVIRLITNKADPTRYAAKTDLGLSAVEGGDLSSHIGGMVNIPLVDDELAFRAVGYYRKDGGFLDNQHRNEENVNSGKVTGGRMSLVSHATDDLTLSFAIRREEVDREDTAWSYGDLSEGGRTDQVSINPERLDSTFTLYSLTADYDFGSTTLTSITSIADREATMGTDLTRIIDIIFGTGLDPDDYDAYISHETETITQELRLASNGDGRLSWTAGAFFIDQEVFATQQTIADALLPDLLLDAIYISDVKEKAIFAEGTYDITDRHSLTLGGRWADNSFAFESPKFEGIFIGAPSPTPLIETTSNPFTPKVSFSYRPNGDLHFYATASKGFRVGQVNFGASASEEIGQSFGPDSLWNYEIGMKSIWMDERLKFNVAAYHIDWSEIQLLRLATLPNGTPLNFVDNAGDATSRGLEVEMVFLPAIGWQIGTSLTYAEATLDSVAEGVAAEPGSTLPGMPDFRASSYVQFTKDDLVDGGSGYIRLDHRYVGEMVSSIDNDVALESESYNVLSARAGINFDRYSFSLYVHNIADSDAATNRYQSNWNPDYAFRLMPRSYGLSLIAGF